MNGKTDVELVGYEFKVVQVEETRILLVDENGQLYEINAVADGTGEAHLQYYKMNAEQLEVT
jgi:hypothetical protein